ncbi:hypothetical protein AAFF_G00390540 [Aldrovandia affinis]|uniref:Uncharacterized protein n=1 Tax=Aldrovandia affinis TaxID=143900 RepID=A0AAD7WLB4_9TELE|nr:hypothetical protein AAFF_G00390540 [Aldrovandia affinis]
MGKTFFCSPASQAGDQLPGRQAVGQVGRQAGRQAGGQAGRRAGGQAGGRKPHDDISIRESRTAGAGPRPAEGHGTQSGTMVLGPCPVGSQLSVRVLCLELRSSPGLSWSCESPSSAMTSPHSVSTSSSSVVGSVL